MSQPPNNNQNPPPNNNGYNNNYPMNNYPNQYQNGYNYNNMNNPMMQPNMNNPMMYPPNNMMNPMMGNRMMNPMGGMPMNMNMQMGNRAYMPPQNMMMQQQFMQNQNRGFPRAPLMNQNRFNQSPIAMPNTSFVIDKKSTVYIGKITDKIEDEQLQKMLRIFGDVDEWRRVTDPKTDKMKNFGFCDYHSAEGANSAVAVLNGKEIFGSAILVKADKKTQKFLDEYKEGKMKKWMNDNKKEEDEESKKEYDEQQQKNLDAIEEKFTKFIKSLSENKVEEEKEKVKNELFAIQSTAERITKTSSTIDVESRKKELSSQIKEFRSRERDRENVLYEPKERRKERSAALRRILDKEKQIEKSQKHFLEVKESRENKRREKDIYMYEKSENFRERELADLISSSDSDSNKTNDEKKKIVKKERKRKRRAYENLYEFEKMISRLKKEKDRYYRLELSELSSGNESEEETTKGIGFDLSIKRYNESRDEKDRIKNIFNAEEEESELKRNHNQEFMNFNKEELEKLKSMDESIISKIQNKSSLSKKEIEDMLDPQNIFKEIPKEKDDLFEFDTNWDIIIKFSLHKKLTEWIDEKVQEIFGEKEETLVEFILTEISKRTPASALCNELSPFLDLDTEPFVTKLWKMLLFEQIKTEREVKYLGKSQ